MADSVTKSIIVKRSRDDVYRLWENFENFPRFMKYIKAVTKTGAETSHWVMEGPLGKDLEWNARLTRAETNQRIAWNSTDGDIKTSGQVTFQDLPHHETQITVMMHYEPPAGKAGEAVAKMLADPEQRLEEDLRHFKAFAERMHERL